MDVCAFFFMCFGVLITVGILSARISTHCLQPFPFSIMQSILRLTPLSVQFGPMLNDTHHTSTTTELSPYSR